jgi:hypothetical protein
MSGAPTVNDADINCERVNRILIKFKYIMKCEHIVKVVTTFAIPKSNKIIN